MKIGINYTETEKYKIQCTGQTVYVFDKNGNELKRFRDMTYAYACAVSPCGDILAVKSTEGQLAIYSLETLSLIKKFRFSSVRYAQDDGFCFSSDGKRFVNVERQIDDLHSAISVYDTLDFSLVSRLLLTENEMIDTVEYTDGECFVLGYERKGDGIDCFIGKFENDGIYERVKILKKEYDFLFLQSMSDLSCPLTDLERNEFLKMLENTKHIRLTDAWRTGGIK